MRCLFLHPLSSALFLYLFSYLIAVCSKSFLSQPGIFTFCASILLLQPYRGEERGRDVSEWHVVWCDFSGNIKLNNTVPKP